MNQRIRLGLLAGAIAAGWAVRADELGINDLPDVKEGLWESSMSTAGSKDKPVHTTMCNSNAVNRKMFEDTHKNPNRPCKEIHSERKGPVITTEVECTFGGKVTRTKSITTLTGNTGLRLETHKADDTVETVIDSKWVGACPAGMKLGDVTGPDGKVMFNAMAP